MSSFWDDLTKAAGDALGSFGNWLGDTLGNAGEAIGDTAANAGNWVSEWGDSTPEGQPWWSQSTDSKYSTGTGTPQYDYSEYSYQSPPSFSAPQYDYSDYSPNSSPSWAQQVEPYSDAAAWLAENPRFVTDYWNKTGDVLGTLGRAGEYGMKVVEAPWELATKPLITSVETGFDPEKRKYFAEATKGDSGISAFDQGINESLSKAYAQGVSPETAKETIWDPNRNAILEGAVDIANPLSWALPGPPVGKIAKVVGKPVTDFLATNGMKVVRLGDEAENLVGRTLSEYASRPEGTTLEEGADILNRLIKGDEQLLKRSPQEYSRPEVQKVLSILNDTGYAFPPVREVKPFNLPADEAIALEKLAKLPGANKDEILEAIAKLNAQDEAQRLSQDAIKEFSQKAGDVVRNAYAKELGYNPKEPPINLPGLKQAYELNRWVKRQTGPLFLSANPRYHVANFMTNVISHLQGGHTGFDTAKHIERRLGQLEGLSIPAYIEKDLTGTTEELAKGAKKAIVERVPGIGYLSRQGQKLANWVERSAKLNTFENQYYKSYNQLWQKKVAELGITDPAIAGQLAMSAHLGQTKQMWKDIANGKVTQAFSSETIKAYSSLPAEYKFVISEELAKNPDKVAALDTLIRRIKGAPDRANKATNRIASENATGLRHLGESDFSESHDILETLNPDLPGQHDHQNAVKALRDLVNNRELENQLADEFEAQYLKNRAAETIDNTLKRFLPTGGFSDHIGTGKDLRRNELGLLAYYMRRSREHFGMELTNPKFTPAPRGQQMSWVKFNAESAAKLDPVSLYGLDGGVRKLEELYFTNKAGIFSDKRAEAYAKKFYISKTGEQEAKDFTAWPTELKQAYADRLTKALADKGLSLPRPDLLKDANELWKADPRLRPQILSKMIEKEAPELKALDPTKPLTAGDVEAETAKQAINVLKAMKAEAKKGVTPSQPISVDLDMVLAAQRDAMAQASREAEQEAVRLYRDYRQRDKLDAILDTALPYQYWFRRNAAFQVVWAAENPGKALAILKGLNTWWQENKDLPPSQRLTVPLGEVNGTDVRLSPVSMLFPFGTQVTSALGELAPGSPYDQGIVDEIKAGDIPAALRSGYNILSRGFGAGPNVAITTGARAAQRAAETIGDEKAQAISNAIMGPAEDASMPLFPQEEPLKGLLAAAGITPAHLGQNALYGTDVSKQQRVEIASILAVRVDAGEISMADAAEAMRKGDGNPLYAEAKTEAVKRIGLTRAANFMGLPLTTTSQDKAKADELKAGYSDLPAYSEERKAYKADNPEINLLWNANASSEDRDALSRTTQYTEALEQLKAQLITPYQDRAPWDTERREAEKQFYFLKNKLRDNLELDKIPEKDIPANRSLTPEEEASKAQQEALSALISNEPRPEDFADINAYYQAHDKWQGSLSADQQVELFAFKNREAIERGDYLTLAWEIQQERINEAGAQIHEITNRKKLGQITTGQANTLAGEIKAKARAVDASSLVDEIMARAPGLERTAVEAALAGQTLPGIDEYSQIRKPFEQQSDYQARLVDSTRSQGYTTTQGYTKPSSDDMTGYTYTATLEATKQAKGKFWNRWNSLNAKEKALAQQDSTIKAILDPELDNPPDEATFILGYNQLAAINQSAQEQAKMGLDNQKTADARTAFWGALTELPKSAVDTVKNDVLVALAMKKGVRYYVPPEVYADALYRMRELLTGEPAPKMNMLTQLWIEETGNAYSVKVPSAPRGAKRYSRRSTNNGPDYFSDSSSVFRGPRWNMRGN